LIADPSGFAIGYLVLFAFCLFGFLLIFVFVPSLRKYRRKRNIVIYATVGIILSLLVVQACEVSLRPALFTVHIVDYPKIPPLKTNQLNQLNLTCTTYLGDRATSFYLVFTGENISFIEKQQDYVLTNTTTIKIPFTTPYGRDMKDVQIKPLLFRINENVTSFKMYPLLEQINGQVIMGSGIWDIWGKLNSTEKGYRINVQEVSV
jgi:hypothetical protein